MAASILRKSLFYFNTCALFLPSRLSRLYHTSKSNIEVLSYGNRYGNRASRCCRRCFSDNSGGGDQKLPVSVVFSPRSPLRWLSNKMKLFMVHSFFDSDFDEEKFLEGAKQAICTVSALISQRKFNELEGLLTDEAIQSVKLEVDNLNNIEALHVKMEHILQTTIHDIGFQYDENEKGRKWLHIMVSAYICQGNEFPREDQLGRNRITFIRIPLPRITKYSFRKECTLGMEDSWIITRMMNLNQDKG